MKQTRTKQKIEISCVVVSYNHEEHLNNLFSSIEKNSKDKRIEVVLIDNNSTDNSVQIAKDYKLSCPKVIIANKQNKGYAKAVNQGCALARGEYLFILNPDIILLDNCLTLLLEKIKKRNDIGIIAPQLMNRDGSIQYSCRRFPSPLMLLSRNRIINAIFPTVRLKYEMRELDHAKEQSVDWICGGCFIIKKSVMGDIQGFDETFFLYLEDTDLCRRVNKRARVVYYPFAKALHPAQYGSRKKLISFLHHLRSATHYFLKYKGKD